MNIMTSRLNQLAKLTQAKGHRLIHHTIHCMPLSMTWAEQSMTQHDGHDSWTLFNATFALLHPDYNLHGKLPEACMHALHKTLAPAMTDDPVSILLADKPCPLALSR